MAHASRHHWQEVGKPLQWAVGEWQVSHVYAVLKRPEPALYHARRGLEICRRHGLRDFTLAYAYESLARATGIGGVWRASARFARLAAKAGDRIREKADREQFLKDLATLPRRR